MEFNPEMGYLLFILNPEMGFSGPIQKWVLVQKRALHTESRKEFSVQKQNSIQKWVIYIESRNGFFRFNPEMGFSLEIEFLGLLFLDEMVNGQWSIFLQKCSLMILLKSLTSLCRLSFVCSFVYSISPKECQSSSTCCLSSSVMQNLHAIRMRWKIMCLFPIKNIISYNK